MTKSSGRCRVPYIFLPGNPRLGFLFFGGTSRAVRTCDSERQVLSNYPARIPLDQIVCPDLPEAPSICWRSFGVFRYIKVERLVGEFSGFWLVENRRQLLAHDSKVSERETCSIGGLRGVYSYCYGMLWNVLEHRYENTAKAGDISENRISWSD